MTTATIGLHPSDPAYWRALRNPPTETETGPYPAPERTSREAWPDGVTTPGPVLQLQRLGEAHGWAVTVTYSRGHLPHKTTGRPGEVADWFAVRMLHTESRARFVATYYVRGDTKAWDGTLISAPTIPPYAGCNITEGKEYVRASGRVLPSFVDAVRLRLQEAESKAKAAPKKASAKRRESGG